MSFDPTIGRWLSEDPSGFQAADANLYRYVGNNPTNFVDPSGLAAAPPTRAKFQTFTIADGRMAAVRVETNVRLKGDPGWAKLTFRAQFDADKSIADYHWLQFAFRYRKEGDKYIPGIFTADKFFHKFATDRRGKDGLAVDTKSRKSPYYDESGQAERDNGGILEIWDKPDTDTKGASTETGTVLDAYLVNKKTGKVYAHVHYERVSRYNDKDRKWTTDWEDVYAELVTVLPPELAGAKLHAGWEDKEFKKPFTFPSPKFNVK